MTALRDTDAATGYGAGERGSGAGARPTPPMVLPRSLRIRVCRSISAWLIRHPFRGANRLRRWLAYLLMPRPGGPVVVGTTMGCSLRVDPVLNRGLERELYYQGTYEAGTLYVPVYPEGWQEHLKPGVEKRCEELLASLDTGGVTE